MARPLRSVDGMLGPVVAETLAGLTLTDADKAAARLARTYADAIDQADEPAALLEKLGPKLLDALEALGATPRARARTAKGGGAATGGSKSKLAALRETRRPA